MVRELSCNPLRESAPAECAIYGFLLENGGTIMMPPQDGSG
jgi:hypothetical protein